MEQEKLREKRKKWEKMSDDEKRMALNKISGEGTEEEKKQRRLEQAKRLKLKWKENHEMEQEEAKKRGEKQRPDEEYWGD